MPLESIQYGLGALSGGLVGFTLGLFGGGGSILAVPLMVYVVGVPNPHLAIGTSAFAVAANAFANLLGHARFGNVKWRCAGVYSLTGIAGAFIGSSIGKMIDGQHLLILFALLMLVVGALMFKGRGAEGDPDAQCSSENAPKVIAFGGLTGAFSGFFGIGGGFLIVPGLIAATGMPILFAIGSSLLAVTAFGLTTALNYAYSGLVDWVLAAVFIGGGIVGGLIGAFAARGLAARKGVLNTFFALLIFVVAGYMLFKGYGQLVT
ncbi:MULTISPECIES: sulfite exporter TauE/SafE family protein [Rhizobium/Agrobacterium group]|uniref:Probable membrane transporter protein n=2 Tax=Rhizobium/Agrobacterium group TaxID=227290 RepID=A0A9X3R1S2_9HYPH|nr:MULTISPECIES: sulfite exporter TauE/SafE family protein [Rhizobium/Agrobacterium group]MBO9126250.1 sulfite exporter TauE/SafE family protein [Rhizobium sp. 16-488-2b]MBO9176834.1 sulfite exporter TauE/SafE family protein [Rhizobium sp. 16-488-2a]MBO9197403.1 sulfite exporter TauE/SafE family protein [Rhizobium sp. 16-449-1b]MCZ7466731.1 sulfite exporter TauE/SafE family protein [Rhizobium rhizogenes]MCZ7939235.1 sulfite exporter TauE/SafE family protein [Agrobacterium salinitolerans]